MVLVRYFYRGINGIFILTLIFDFIIADQTSTTGRPKEAPNGLEKTWMKQAATNGLLDRLIDFFDDRNVDMEAVIDDDLGFTVLHYAAYFDYLKIFELYEEKGADLMPKQAKSPKRTPLHFAAQQGNLFKKSHL